MKKKKKVKKFKRALRKRLRKKIFKIWCYLVIIAEFFEDYKNFSKITILLLSILIIVLEIVKNVMQW